MSQPFSSMFSRRYSKRQVTNRDFNFMQDWNSGTSDTRNPDNQDSHITKVTPRAQYIISESKPSPVHGSHHISELSDLISSSPVPVVFQSPLARAIPVEQQSFANEEGEEENEEDELGRDGDASMADSIMAVKDDRESETDSFVVEASVQHAQLEDMDAASQLFRKETGYKTRFSTSNHTVSATGYSDHSDHKERTEDMSDGQDEEEEVMEEVMEVEEQVAEYKKSNISPHFEKEGKKKDVSNRQRRRSRAEVDDYEHDRQKEKEGKERPGARFSYLDRKSPYDEKINNNDNSYGRRLRSSGSNSGESLEVQAMTSDSVVDDTEDQPQESNQSNKDLKAYRHSSPYRKREDNQRHYSPDKRSMDNQGRLSLNRRGISYQKLSSPNKTGTGTGYQTLSSPNKTSMDKQRCLSPNRRSTGNQMLSSPNKGSMNQRKESYEDDRNDELEHENRESLNNTENARKSVSRSSDKALQDQSEKKAHSEREKQLMRSSLEQNALDVSDRQNSEYEEEESTGERKVSLSNSRTEVPPEGTSNVEEVMEEAADDDMEQDITMNDMEQENITQDESTASVMIRSTIQDTPVTNRSPQNFNKRRLINKINDDKGKQEDEKDDDGTSVQASSSVPSLPKQKKISFSSETKNPGKKKKAQYVHKVELWQGEMEKRPKRSVLDLDIVFNHLDKEIQHHVSRGKDNLTMVQRKECHLLSRVRRSIIDTIEAVEEVRQKRSDIIRAKRNIKDYRTELTELQQRNVRLSEKLKNKENEKEYRKKLLNDWITDFENLMVASHKIKSKTTTKDMVIFGYQPNIK